MALYDNKFWMLSHIRNSFITTDATGMCETAMSGESKDIKKHLSSLEPYPGPSDSEDDDDEPNSYDIETEFEFGIRERSNTAAQLDRVEQKKKSSKMQHIKWELGDFPTEYFDELFIKRDVTTNHVEKKKSLLSELIKQTSDLPVNPFMDYSKYDGSGQTSIPTKTYKIFLTMLPEHQRNYPMNVCCVSSAKVEDLIGLILLQLSIKYPDVHLKSITNYGLYYTEDNGEVDSDFPSVERNECIAKFGFPCLGLVEETGKTVTFEPTEVIIQSEDFSRKKTPRDSKQEEKQIIENQKIMDDHNKSVEAPLYQSFRVFKVINKVRAKFEILLGISGEKIEIDPIQHKNSKFNLLKQKAISHHMDTVAWCEITEEKTNRTCFKIVYSLSFANQNPVALDASFTGTASSIPPLQSSASFKQYDFEADNSTANEVVRKINLILDLRSSASRKEYIAAKERKHYKRKSFNLGKK